MKTVIYHSADYDGIFCREIAKRFLGPGHENDTNQFIGWNFGDPPLPIPESNCESIYVMDLPLDAPFGVKMPLGLTGVVRDGRNSLVWIDHHKSSIESHPKDIPGYRIDGVAACRLAWQWFRLMAQTPNPEEIGLPSKKQFIDRKVIEPKAVRLAGEYDIWDKRDPYAETFQYGLRSQNQIPFELLLEGSQRGADMTNQVIADGQSAQLYAQNVDFEICKSLTWLMEWEGLKFLCVNHARFNSLLFAAKDVPETGHDALLGFRFDGKSWMVSLYHAAHRKDLDLSQIAKKHGGGGHRGACGFTCSKLPFI